jgi:hypothetical protein
MQQTWRMYSMCEQIMLSGIPCLVREKGEALYQIQRADVKFGKKSNERLL